LAVFGQGKDTELARFFFKKGKKRVKITRVGAKRGGRNQFFAIPLLREVE